MIEDTEVTPVAEETEEETPVEGAPEAEVVAETTEDAA